MLALYHNITVRKRRVLKQRLQIQQRTAADRGHGRQAHTAAGHRIEHPLRNLQEPHSWVLIDAAPEHTSPILGQSFVDRYSAGVPRMPRVTDFSRFDIMGVALSTRTTKTGHIWDWRRIRQQVGGGQFLTFCWFSEAQRFGGAEPGSRAREPHAIGRSIAETRIVS